MDAGMSNGVIWRWKGGGRGRVGVPIDRYLNAKIVPSYKDNQVVGREPRKLDHKLGRVIIRLKPPTNRGAWLTGGFIEFGHFVRLWGLGHWTRA